MTAFYQIAKNLPRKRRNQKDIGNDVVTRKNAKDLPKLYYDPRFVVVDWNKFSVEIEGKTVLMVPMAPGWLAKLDGQGIARFTLSTEPDEIVNQLGRLLR